MRIGCRPVFGFLFFVVPVVATPLSGAILEPNNPMTVTQTITSGPVTLGVSDLGGGYINYLQVAGDTNVVAGGFGRGGQADIRDWYHNSRYNPTQAGFRDGAGTPAQVLTGTAGGIAPWIRTLPFATPLFSQPVFDFTQDESLYPDLFGGDGGATDTDGIPEINITQTDEVRSEFDFETSYQDMSDFVTPAIGVFLCRGAWDYVRPAGPMLQFGIDAVTAAGDTVLREDACISDIAPELPGIQTADSVDMQFFTSAWSIRVRWTEGYHHVMWVDSLGAWDSTTVTVCQDDRRIGLYGDNYTDLFCGAGTPPGAAWKYMGGNPSGPAFVDWTSNEFLCLSRGVDPDTSRAIGLYFPQSARCNEFPVARVEAATGTILSEGDRRMRSYLNARRQACGFDPGGAPESQVIEGATIENDFTALFARTYLTGLQAPRATEHERVRSELFLLVGTPNEIRQAVADLEPLVPYLDCTVVPGLPVSVESAGDAPPVMSGLSAYPNPARRSTTIRYSLPGATEITVRVHDARGRLVRTLVSGKASRPGAGEVRWDGRDENGRLAPSGIYFVTLKDAGTGERAVRKVTLLR